MLGSHVRTATLVNSAFVQLGSSNLFDISEKICTLIDIQTTTDCQWSRPRLSTGKYGGRELR